MAAVAEFTADHQACSACGCPWAQPCRPTTPTAGTRPLLLVSAFLVREELTLDVPFREDDCRLRWGHALAVMGILRRANLNMVRTVQQNFRPDLSIGLLRDKIGRNPALLAPILA